MLRSVTFEERQLYSIYNLEVVWIDAILAVYEELVRNIRSYPKQMAIQVM